MATARYRNPEALLRADVRRIDALIRKARAVHDSAPHATAVLGSIRLEAELVQRRRSVVLALASLIAATPAATLRAMRAGATADRSFKAGAVLYAEEMRLENEVPDQGVDLETAYASLDLPTRRWLQRRLDEDLARSSG